MVTLMKTNEFLSPLSFLSLSRAVLLAKILPFLFSPKRKSNVLQSCSPQNLENACFALLTVLQRTAEKHTSSYFARTVPFCCLLTLLFSGVLHNTGELINFVIDTFKNSPSSS